MGTEKYGYLRLLSVYSILLEIVRFGKYHFYSRIMAGLLRGEANSYGNSRLSNAYAAVVEVLGR